ncbi:MAG: hypothetical protein OXC68_12660 [Aestuariivita sp.]|nr:hypothetical protein [Aestuariivita sp.]
MPLPQIMAGIAKYVVAAGVGGAVGFLATDHYQKKWGAEKKKRRQERRKWKDCLNEFQFKSRGRCDVPEQGQSTSTFEPNTSCLEITNESGDAILSIAKIDDPGNIKWEAVTSEKGRKSQIYRLDSFLSSVPNLGIVGEVLTGNYAKVSVPLSELSGSKASQTAKSALIHSDGTIKKHAHLEPGKLQGLVTGAVLWNIASVALAQKHLHDISKKFDDISKNIEEVSRFQKEERYSKLEGTLRAFMNMKREITDLEFSEMQLATVNTECFQLEKIEAHIEKDMSRALQEFKDIAGLGSDFDKAIHRVVMLLKECMLCQVAKLYGYQILLFAEENPGRLRSRLDDVKNVLDVMCDRYREIVSTIMEILDKDKHSSDSLENLAGLRKTRELEKNSVLLEKEIAITHQLISARNSPVNVLLKLDKDKIESFAFADA